MSHYYYLVEITIIMNYYCLVDGDRSIDLYFSGKRFQNDFLCRCEYRTRVTLLHKIFGILNTFPINYFYYLNKNKNSSQITETWCGFHKHNAEWSHLFSTGCSVIKALLFASLLITRKIHRNEAFLYVRL